MEEPLTEKMKIGILTTHDSTNYGAQLQAYALQRVLVDLGHDVRVIDFRRNPNGKRLKRHVTESRRLKLRRMFSFAGGWVDLFRRLSAERFLKSKIQLTQYHMTSWQDMQKNIDFDLIIVGSDQVWNPEVNDIANYMPSRFTPNGIPWISYAASLGVASITDRTRHLFCKQLPLFSAISVRESSSVEILADIGICSEHVVDPVVLAGKDCWANLAKTQKTEQGRILVYSLAMGRTIDVAHKVSCFARRENVCADLFTEGLELLALPSPFRPRGYVRNLAHWLRLFSTSRVSVHLSAGPIRFLRSLINSEFVITNSYHGLVFASIFGKEVRFIIPTSKLQLGRMNRIRDFVDPIIQGPVWQPSIDSALESLANGEHTRINLAELERRRTKSFEWLKSAIEKSQDIHTLGR